LIDEDDGTDCLLMGDFNLKQDEDLKMIRADFRDCWTENQSEDKSTLVSAYSYDSTTKSLTEVKKGRRIDRFASYLSFCLNE
jgi:hypothetical protein